MTILSRLAALLILLLGSSFNLRAQDFSRIPATKIYTPQQVPEHINFPTGNEACAAAAERHNALVEGTTRYVRMSNPSFVEKHPSLGPGCYFDYTYVGNGGGYPNGTTIRMFAQNYVLPGYVCPIGYSRTALGTDVTCSRPAVGMKDCPQCPASRVGNPIDFGSSVKIYRAIDISETDGLGFTRTYRSRGPVASTTRLGEAWFADHLQRLDLLGGSEGSPAAVSAMGPDGSAVLFRPTGSGQWVTEADQRGFVLVEVFGTADARYTLTRPNGDRETYGPTGALLQLHRASGSTLNYVYDADLLKEVRNEKGRALKFGYDSIRRLASVSSGSGELVAFTYASDLLHTASASGYAERYTYESRQGDSSYLTGVDSEQAGEVARYNYDSQGMPISTRRAGADVYVVDYSVPGQLKVTNPLGATATYFFHTALGTRVIDKVERACANCATAVAEYVRDAGLNVVEERSSDTKTCRRFDTTRNLEVWRADGVTVADSCTRPTSLRQVETDWNSELRVPVARRTRDASGALIHGTVWTHNIRGQATAVTQTDMTTGESRTTANRYCEQADLAAGLCPIVGLITQVDGPNAGRGDAIDYQYYGADHPECATSSGSCAWRKGDLWRIINGLGQTRETLRYDGAGRVLSIKDSNGVITDFEYDARGRLTERRTSVSQ